METQKVELDHFEAGRLYREYLAERNYAKPVDDEIRRVYREIARGGIVIRALDSIRQAGVDERGLPRLAIVRASNEECYFSRYHDGGGRMAAHPAALRRRNVAADLAFEFPPGSFPQPITPQWQHHRAIAPLIPLRLRPKQGLHNYHLLWEAEWERVAPVDPLLLRRLGKADMWLVVAAWDLTEVEQLALTARIRA